MATKVKDQATAELAARNLQNGVEPAANTGEPNAPKEKSTSEKLFPEFVTDDGGIVNRPVKPFEDKAKTLLASDTPVPDVLPQTPPTVTPPGPVYLKPEELTGKMVKLKVDGIETDVPADTLIKTTQLERHLNTQLQNLASERTKLEAEKLALLSKPPVSEQPTARKDDKRTPETEALEARIAQMQQQMESLQQSMLPALQESGIKRVEQMAKERLGTDDFRAYFDQIKQSALLELAKPDVAANPQARSWFDSDTFYFQKYQELKLKDLVSKPAQTPDVRPNAPALVTQTGAPVVMNSQGQPVSIPAFESSGGVSSRSSQIGDWQMRAQQAFDAARRTGRTEDWVSYYKLKSEAPN